MMRRVMVDYDEDVQNLRDVRTGRYVELTSIVDCTIVGVSRGENDQLILVLDGDFSDEPVSEDPVEAVMELQDDDFS